MKHYVAAAGSSSPSADEDPCWQSNKTIGRTVAFICTVQIRDRTVIKIMIVFPCFHVNFGPPPHLLPAYFPLFPPAPPIPSRPCCMIRSRPTHMRPISWVRTSEFRRGRPRVASRTVGRQDSWPGFPNLGTTSSKEQFPHFSPWPSTVSAELRLSDKHECKTAVWHDKRKLRCDCHVAAATLDVNFGALTFQMRAPLRRDGRNSLPAMLPLTIDSCVAS